MIDFDVTRRANEFQTPPGFELGVQFSICVSGFDTTAPIDAVVTLPNGGQRRRLMPPEDVGELPRIWEFFTFPPDPLGAYQVQATQGSISATATFTILAPTEPKIELLSRGIRVGRSVPVALSGFDPREKVVLRLYRATGQGETGGEETQIFSRGPRVASFRVDTQGFARRRVVVRRPGSYLLAAGSLFDSGFGFEVSRDG